MTIWLKLGVSLAALSIPAVLPQAGYAADAGHPTVVELFQSQGCSDCPPAAANVAAISDRPDVLALSFAVDYWDRLGWKDTFSKPAWTARQYAYAHAMGRDDVYTPQVVVNGRVEGDGLEPAALAGLVSRGDRGAGGPSVGLYGRRGRGRSGRGASGRGGRVARALRSANDRSRSQARRELRAHAAPQGCRAGDGPSRPLVGRGGDVPGARQRSRARGGRDCAGGRNGADPCGGEAIVPIPVSATRVGTDRDGRSLAVRRR